MRRVILALFLGHVVSGQDDNTTTTTTEEETTTTTTTEPETTTTTTEVANLNTTAAANDATTTTTTDSATTTTTTDSATTAAATTAAATTAAATSAVTSAATTAATQQESAVTTAAAQQQNENAATTAAPSNTNTTTTDTTTEPPVLAVELTVGVCTPNPLSKNEYNWIMCSSLLDLDLSNVADLNATFVSPQQGTKCEISDFSTNTCPARRARARQLSGSTENNGKFKIEVTTANAPTAVKTKMKTLVTKASGTADQIKTHIKDQVNAKIAATPAVNTITGGTVEIKTNPTLTDTTPSTGGSSTTTTTGSGAATVFVSQIFGMLFAYLYVAL